MGNTSAHREDPAARLDRQSEVVAASLEKNDIHLANPEEDINEKQKVLDTVTNDGIDNHLPQTPFNTETCTSSSNWSVALSEIKRLQQDIAGLTSKVDQLHRLAVIENARDQREGFLSALMSAICFIPNLIVNLPILGQLFRLVLIANVVCLFKLLLDHDFAPALLRKFVLVILSFVWKLLLVLFSPLIRELNSFLLSSYFLDLGANVGSYIRATIVEGLNSGVVGGSQMVKNFADGVLNSNIPSVVDITLSDAVSDAVTFFSWALNATGNALT